MLVHETQFLPSAVRCVLPIWKMDEAAVERNGLKVEGDFVHQNVGNLDPDLIYSRDAMHQSNPNYVSLN